MERKSSSNIACKHYKFVLFLNLLKKNINFLHNISDTSALFYIKNHNFASSIDSMDSNEDFLGALVKGWEETKNKNVYVGGSINIFIGI